jgi:hypothetical protein
MPDRYFHLECACGRTYDHAAEVAQAGGTVAEDHFKLTFFCPCGTGYPESECVIVDDDVITEYEKIMQKRNGVEI